MKIEREFCKGVGAFLLPPLSLSVHMARTKQTAVRRTRPSRSSADPSSSRPGQASLLLSPHLYYATIDFFVPFLSPYLKGSKKKKKPFLLFSHSRFSPLFRNPNFFLCLFLTDAGDDPATPRPTPVHILYTLFISLSSSI